MDKMIVTINRMISQAMTAGFNQWRMNVNNEKRRVLHMLQKQIEFLATEMQQVRTEQKQQASKGIELQNKDGVKSAMNDLTAIKKNFALVAGRHLDNVTSKTRRGSDFTVAEFGALFPNEPPMPAEMLIKLKSWHWIVCLNRTKLLLGKKGEETNMSSPFVCLSKIFCIPPLAEEQ